MSEALTADILATEPSDSPQESNDAQSREALRPVPGSGEPKADKGTQEKSKHPGAYERAKQRVAAKQAEQAQRDTALKQREETLAQRERALAEASKPQVKKRDYTLSDLRKYRKQWADINHPQYDPDLAAKAEAEIEVMEAEEKASKDIVELPRSGTPEHANQWHQAEQELAQADPEFMRTGTRLDTHLRAIMQGPDGDIYRQHPRGIIAAYHKAKMDILQADNGELSAKVQDLEKELKRYHGLTGVGGGVSRQPGSNGESADFAKLTTAQMKKRLLSNAGRSAGAPLF